MCSMYSTKKNRYYLLSNNLNFILDNHSLRTRAEDILKTKSSKQQDSKDSIDSKNSKDSIDSKNSKDSRDSIDDFSPEKMRQLIHELELHEIELTIQNNNLISAYNELEMSRALYFELYNRAPVGYVTINSDGIILDANLTIAKLLGIEVTNQLINMPFTNFINYQSQDNFYFFQKNLFATESRQCCELHMLDQNKKEVMVSIEGIVDKDSAILDDTVGRLIINDITEEKRILKEKQEMQAQLFYTSKLTSIGILAAGLAHEINNPLTIIMGNIELMEDDCNSSLDVNKLEQINKIKNASIRITSIVNSLRNFARPDTNHLEKIDMHKCINETLDLVKEIYKKENIKLEVCFHAQNYFVQANIGKIQQVIINMLHNAKDAMAKNKEGHIKIVTSNNREEDLLIEIKDNGIGIPKENVCKIFDPFFTTKDLGKGTGLGLSICHAIINSIGGTISVESEDVFCTSFKITIPRTSI
ncbi:MAG: ATP-binding protein [Oligoflexia bacterium]|nr:ATP-binding protein [Oligoflexia bacterium]